MKTIWNKLPKPFFVLAPMEAVTDIVFRKTIAKAGRPDLFFTEFVNVSGFLNPNGRPSALRRLHFEPNDQPIVAQIWGNKPGEFALASIELKKLGYKAVDINMGCPDKAVVKNGCGSALIRNPELASQIINATKTAGLPVSVKTRLNDISLDGWQAWIGFLLAHSLSNLTIHLRTRKEMSKVPAHFECVPEIIKLRNELAPETLITINGDIRDYAHGLELFNQYKVDGIMIGRGVFSNPFVFCKINRAHSRSEMFELLEYHLDLFDINNKNVDQKAFEPLKHFFKIYINNFPGASEYRQKLMGCKDTKEAREVIEELKGESL